MRHAALLLLTALFLSGCGSEPAPTPDAGGEVTISISDSGLRVGGKALTLPGPLSGAVAVLGEPARTLDMVNTIAVWDDRGLYVMADKTSGQAGALGVAFRETGYRYWPKQLRGRSIDIAGQAISPGMTKDDVRKAGFTSEPDMAFLWKRKLGGLEVTVEVDPQVDRVVSVDVEAAR